jgi:uncharacterized membrane protein
MAAAASTLIGGPLGRHAVVGGSRFWTPLRVVLLAAVLTLALGWLVKAPCLQQYTDSDGGLALDWQGGRQYVSMCYTDIVTLYADHRLVDGELPYATSWNTQEYAGPPEVHYMDYPVVTGFFLWLTARLTGRYAATTSASDGSGGPASLLPTALPEVLYFNITAVFLAAAWLLVVCAVRRQRPARPWDAMLVAISPLALLHVFTGTDAIAVAASAVGLYAFARGRSAVAGVLLGVAAAAKLYAALLLIPLLLVHWRRSQVSSESGHAPRAVLAAALTWFALNVPVAIYFTPGWLEFFRTSVRAHAAPDSLYFALSYFTGWPGFDGELAPDQTPAGLNLVVPALFLVCCAGLVVLVHRAPRPPRLASLCFLIVAAALLVNKSWNPQFSLWLVPLAVLALPRWRLLLTWMTIDALVWVPRMFYYLGVDNKGVPPDIFLGAVLVRDAVLVLLVVLVIRSVLYPRTDRVRILGADDPDWPEPAGPPARSVSAAPSRAGLP